MLLHKTDSEPQLSIEQTRELIERIKKLQTIDPATVAAIKREIMGLPRV